jgi:hypothetical protein
VKRNCICHVYPRVENDAFPRCAAHLRARRRLFDGVRVVAIVTDQTTLPASRVKRVLEDFECEFIEKPNDPNMRETHTWLDLWERIPRDDSATFCCHAKGATKRIPEIQWWTDVMWHVLGDHPVVTDEALAMKQIVGCFRRRDFNDYPWPVSWHFSGTFYWVRSDSAPRGAVDQHGWATEAWPGRHFREEDSCCLFMDHTASLYDRRYWDEVVIPAFRYWRAALRSAGLSTTDCSTTDWSMLPGSNFPMLLGPDGYVTSPRERTSSQRARDFLRDACGCSPR